VPWNKVKQELKNDFFEGTIIKNIKSPYGEYKDIRDKDNFRHNAVQWLRDISTHAEYKFTGFKPGYIYFYNYVPKYRDILSYYDGKPLIIFLKPHADGKTYYGYNIHFIPMKIREQLFKQFRYRSDGVILDSSIWEGLSIIQRLYPVIIRRYLYSHIREKIYNIPMRIYDMENVKLFPSEKFYKKTSDEIFAIAMQEYRKRK
jgi:hypothetical protein